MTLTILACGGRDYTDYDMVSHVLGEWHTGERHVLVVGGAKGADSLAERYGREVGWDVRVYKADWQKNGRAAGPIRNQEMLDAENPDIVVAFPGGRGTADMVKRCQKAFVEQIRVVQ